MKKKKLPRILLELLIYSVILIISNFVFPQDPGYFKNEIINPYLVLALLASTYYGKFAGFFSLLFSLFFIFLPFPYLANFFKLLNLDQFYWINLYRISIIPCAVTLIGTFFLG